MLAAASVSPAIEEIAAGFEARTGVVVRVSAASSSTLAAQVRSGVPADLFLSAHPEWVRGLEESGHVASSTLLLRNRLALVVPSGNPAGVGSARDLVGDRVRLVGLAGESVPAGRYAEEALRSAGVYAALSEGGRLARGSHVRSTLAWVEAAEVEAGVVYLSDAQSSSRVEVVQIFDSSAHSPILYALALLESTEAKDGRAFYEYLEGADAAKVFRRHGFVRPVGPDRLGA